MKKRDPDEARKSSIEGLNFTGPCLLPYALHVPLVTCSQAAPGFIPSESALPTARATQTPVLLTSTPGTSQVGVNIVVTRHSEPSKILLDTEGRTLCPLRRDDWNISDWFWWVRAV